MRPKIVVGNWKMNKTVEEAVSLSKSIKSSLISLSLTEIVLCPPFTALKDVGKIIEKSTIKLGAQDCFWEEEGSFTGEISPKQIKDLAEYVILGHSERRALGETDEDINKKIQTATKAGLNVILCIGESLEHYRKGNYEVVIEQMMKNLKGLTPIQAQKILIAYEPIWAVGAEKAATPAYANQVAVRIRQEAGSLLSRQIADKMQILYGGTVDEKNAASFVKEPEIDGLLVGRASLEPQKFIDIIKSVNKVKK